MSGNNSKDMRAKENKYDEYYTTLSFIEEELSHYAAQFKGKTILCPCDNPKRSKFWEYLHRNLTEFGIEKIIFTFTDAKLGPKHDNDSYAFCYSQSARKSAIQKKREELENNYKGNRSYTKEEKQMFIEDELAAYNPDYDYSVGTISSLKPDSAYNIENGYPVGDFRSKDVKDLMTKCDIVITNPPFSLFQDLVRLLLDKNKKFLVVGTRPKGGNPPLFDLIANGTVSFGYSRSHHILFDVPEDGAQKLLGDESRKEGHGNSYTVKNNKVQGEINACWFTNLDVSASRQALIPYLCNTYNAKDYPKYDNYDAIEVNSFNNIPKDYYGVMGLSVGILERFMPNEFDIVGRHCDARIGDRTYALRIFIRRKDQPKEGVDNAVS